MPAGAQNSDVWPVQLIAAVPVIVQTGSGFTATTALAVPVTVTDP